MKLLVIGGAGNVATIIRPALEAQHDCRYLDLKPARGAEDRSIVGDLNDDALIKATVPGLDGIIYLAFGRYGKGFNDIDVSFGVNTVAVYRWLAQALPAGLKNFIYASSLSVYDNVEYGRTFDWPLDEATPPDAWYPYALTKRLTEEVCRAAGQKYPHARIAALRLVFPANEQDLAKYRTDPDPCVRSALGPGDLQRLFIAALNMPNPGVHVLNASGDVDGKWYSNARATAILGWKPEGN